jgi:predicted DCC family thiol-disulfide oxidoreductase YuxK
MTELTILYDGACPLCLREVRFLRSRDQRLHPDTPRLAFIDIDAPDYDPARHGGIGYRQAMGRIHAIGGDGTVLCDVAVFRRAYDLVGLGWLYAPTRWPLLGPTIDGLYGLWASLRLRLTGRPSLDQLCDLRDGRCFSGHSGASGFPVAASGVPAAALTVPSPSPAQVGDRRADHAPDSHQPRSEPLRTADRGSAASQ